MIQMYTNRARRWNSAFADNPRRTRVSPDSRAQSSKGPNMKLLDQVRQAIRTVHYSIRTERCYVYWIERFIRFHQLKHPNTMGAVEVEQFLTFLAVPDHVSASTQNQALGALLFLYQ